MRGIGTNNYTEENNKEFRKLQKQGYSRKEVAQITGFAYNYGFIKHLARNKIFFGKSIINKWMTGGYLVHTKKINSTSRKIHHSFRIVKKEKTRSLWRVTFKKHKNRFELISEDKYFENEFCVIEKKYVLKTGGKK